MLNVLPETTLCIYWAGKSRTPVCAFFYCLLSIFINSFGLFCISFSLVIFISLVHSGLWWLITFRGRRVPALAYAFFCSLNVFSPCLHLCFFSLSPPPCTTFQRCPAAGSEIRFYLPWQIKRSPEESKCHLYSPGPINKVAIDPRLFIHNSSLCGRDINHRAQYLCGRWGSLQTAAWDTNRLTACWISAFELLPWLKTPVHLCVN